MIQNIIWDVDGTLFDTYPAISQAFLSALNDLGGDAPIDWIMEAAKRSLGYCVTALAGRCHLKEDDIGNKFSEYYDQTSPLEQPPFPGVIKVCQYISSIHGKNFIVTHRGSKGLTELLAAHQMAAYFTGWITRDDGYPKKPDPAAFEATIKIHQINKKETLTVGDRDIDILAGNKAGVSTCLFGRGAGESTADLSITAFDELYNYLLGLRE